MTEVEAINRCCAILDALKGSGIDGASFFKATDDARIIEVIAEIGALNEFSDHSHHVHKGTDQKFILTQWRDNLVIIAKFWDRPRPEDNGYVLVGIPINLVTPHVAGQVFDYLCLIVGVDPRTRNVGVTMPNPSSS